MGWFGFGWYQDERDIARARARTPRGVADRSQPPEGAWWEVEGEWQEVGATTRRPWLAALVTLLIVAWVACGVLAALPWFFRWIGILGPAGRPLPSPGGELLLVFGLGLLLAMVGAGYAAIRWWGTTVVRMHEDRLEISTGIDVLRLRKRMPSSEAVSVSEYIRIVRTRGWTLVVKQVAIARREGKPLRFGSLLSERRRWWVRAMVGQMLGVPDVTPSLDDTTGGPAGAPHERWKDAGKVAGGVAGAGRY